VVAPAGAGPARAAGPARSAVSRLVRAALDSAIAEAEARSPGSVAALDAGCGRVSALEPFRARIGRLVGADIHPLAAPLPHLDEFVIADLCGSSSAFPDESFDVVLSSFTIEHFADPAAALANMRRWLRPGGVLVATTVNRRHPFVWAYLAVPSLLRGRAQRLIKASAADAHPLVGACNSPALLGAAAHAAGFSDVRLETVGHLERAWGRIAVGRWLGRLGDALAAPFASRRSTLVLVARR
jgi:SAM-dependent methyltransferase